MIQSKLENYAIISLVLLAIIALGIFICKLNTTKQSVPENLFKYKIEILKDGKVEKHYSTSFIMYGDCIEFISGTSEKEIYNCSLISITKNF